MSDPAAEPAPEPSRADQVAAFRASVPDQVALLRRALQRLPAQANHAQVRQVAQRMTAFRQSLLSAYGLEE